MVVATALHEKAGEAMRARVGRDETFGDHQEVETSEDSFLSTWLYAKAIRGGRGVGETKRVMSSPETS